MHQPDTRPLRFDDRAAFRAWALQQGRRRFERQNGAVVAMAPERVDHARIKAQVWEALKAAIRSTGAPCEAFVDGPTVEIDGRTDFEPDVVVTCGARTEGSALAVRNPVIVVEVLSPSTGERDAGEKLDGYFRLPSVQHYLMVSAQARMVIHHSRLDGEKLLTQLHRSGEISLEPPGFRISVAAVYAGTDLDISP